MFLENYLPIPAPTTARPISSTSLVLANARKRDPAMKTRLDTIVTPFLPIKEFNPPPTNENNAAKPTVIVTISSCKRKQAQLSLVAKYKGFFWFVF